MILMLKFEKRCCRPSSVHLPFHSFIQQIVTIYPLIALLLDTGCIVVNKTDTVFALAEFKFFSGEQWEFVATFDEKPMRE